MITTSYALPIYSESYTECESETKGLRTVQILEGCGKLPNPPKHHRYSIEKQAARAECPEYYC